MKSLRIPIFFSFLTIALVFLNLLALMRLIPIFITIPLLFISIYITLYSFVNRRLYNQFRQRNWKNRMNTSLSFTSVTFGSLFILFYKYYRKSRVSSITREITAYPTTDVKRINKKLKNVLNEINPSHINYTYAQYNRLKWTNFPFFK